MFLNVEFGSGRKSAGSATLDPGTHAHVEFNLGPEADLKLFKV
jgi:hypothetical protein